MFVHKVRPNKNQKALLILDNHESHKSYGALKFAHDNHVIFLSIPTHTSHSLQPLDVAVYGPRKKYFEYELSFFQKMHLGRVINQYDVAKLFARGYLKGASPSNAISGFHASGIYPFNKNIIAEEHFLPSEIYQANFLNNTPLATTTAVSIESSDLNIYVTEREPNANENSGLRITRSVTLPNSDILELTRPKPVRQKKKCRSEND